MGHPHEAKIRREGNHETVDGGKRGGRREAPRGGQGVRARRMDVQGRKAPVKRKPVDIINLRLGNQPNFEFELRKGSYMVLYEGNMRHDERIRADHSG